MIKAAGVRAGNSRKQRPGYNFRVWVVASLVARRKDKRGGEGEEEEGVPRVLFDGTNDIPVNRRIRLRDQERAPAASDLKRCMREKAQRGANFLIDGGRCRSAPAGAHGQARLAFTRLPGRGGRRRIY